VLNPDDRKVREHHLLAVPPNVEPDELEVLAVSRFGRATWESEGSDGSRPRTGVLPAVTAALGIRRVEPAMPRLRLGRLSSLVGPYQLQPSGAVALGLPLSSDTVWLAQTLHERGEPPFSGGGDRDGMRRAFPEGLPIREEERVVRWMIDAARRLGGAVRVHDSGAVIAPDPSTAVDLTVMTTQWPSAQMVLARVRRVVPRAQMSGEVYDHPWSFDAHTTGPTGPATRPTPVVDRAPPGRYQRDRSRPLDPAARAAHEILNLHGVADPTARRRLLAESEAYDQMMTGQQAEGWGIEVDLGLDGMVEVHPEHLEEVPTVLKAAPWAADGIVALRVRWHPHDPEQGHAERPSAEHRVARGRAVPLVNAIAVALWDAFDGEIADESEFLVHPEDLRADPLSGSIPRLRSSE